MSDGWQAERDISPLQFELRLTALGLSQAACGRYLGVSQRTIKRYLEGESPVPVPSALLLAGLVAGGIRPAVPPRRRK